MIKNVDDFLLIIDGSSLLSTQFYGNLPREVLMSKTVEEKEKYYYKIMQTSKGVYTNAVFGFLRALFKIIETKKPKYLAITWDLTRDTFRRELYKDYKANRSETIVPLKEQFALMQDVLKKIGVAQFMSEEFEADDYSGSIANKFSCDVPVFIMTKDHDYLQLINDNVNLFLIQSDQKKADEINKKYNACIDFIPEKAAVIDSSICEEEFGVKPSSIAALKGLMGDSADNIKGVPGIGPKTAISLISHYLDCTSLYNDIDNLSEKEIVDFWKSELKIARNPYGYLTKIDANELVGREAAMLSEKLATIKTDIEINESLDDLSLNLSYDACLEVLKELEFKSIRLPENAFSDESCASIVSDVSEIHELVDDLSRCEEIVDKLKNASTISISITENNGELSSFSVYDGERVYSFICAFFITSDYLKDCIERICIGNKEIICYSYKELLAVSENISSAKDIHLMHYLLFPLNNHEFSDIIADLSLSVKAGDIDEALKAFILKKAYDTFGVQLVEKKMNDLYYNIELPLVRILFDMQKTGINCSKDILISQGEALRGELVKLENEIYSLAAHPFNILSPKQLGVVLFEEQNLPGAKKTKTGYQTGAEVLEKLAPDYPIAKLVLEYRQLSKLISTYIDGLQEWILDDGKIHCKFHQTVTATGRLSSADPNMQNIPIRESLGREIRKAFLPSEGYAFVDADYSQIELRIMAVLSGDEHMIDDFNSGRDIHTATASSVFSVPYDEVSKEERFRAKAVNFGIIYGISSFGLGQDLDISRADAKKYIDSYFVHYPGVKSFLDSTVEEARNLGYSKTLFGRIRPIPELSSTNFMQRSFGERVAMNSPIQGTAADIMKLAMINVDKALKESGLDAKIVLQIHDEIVLEVKEEEVESAKKILEKEMENVCSFSVPLLVSSDSGYSLFDLK